MLVSYCQSAPLYHNAQNGDWDDVQDDAINTFGGADLTDSFSHSFDYNTLKSFIQNLSKINQNRARSCLLFGFKGFSNPQIPARSRRDRPPRVLEP